MEINVLGSQKDWPGRPGLMDDENVYYLTLPDFKFNPIKVFKFFRQAKKCMILYWVVDEKTIEQLGFFSSRLFLPFVKLLVKKPQGPALVIKNKSQKNHFLKIADLVADRVNDAQSHSELFKQAYFLSECGHPDSIYKHPMQKERIDWLKNNSLGKILEIGCSTGFVLNYVRGQVGVDIDELRLEYAKSKFPHLKFVLADASQLSFKNQEFDTVMIPDILEHVPFEHAQKIVQEAKRVSQRLLITVPNAGKKNYDKSLVENPEHRWFPTLEIMRQMMGPQAKLLLSKNEDFIYVIDESRT